MDFLTAGAFAAILILVAANAWIVTRMRVDVRRDGDSRDP